MRRRVLIVIGAVAALGARGRGDRRRGGRRRRRRARPGDHRARRWSAPARPRSKETGGGKVTGTEAGDEEGAYEVEVTRADGSQVDVHLDKAFNVISSEGRPRGPGRRGRE